MMCRFTIDGDVATCTACGRTMRVVRGLRADQYFAECTGDVREQPLGLGDYTEQVLSAIGITKERYVAVKELFGLAPTCDCEERKAWLNRVSDWWRGQKPHGDE